MKWLHNPDQSNVDDANNRRCEGSRKEKGITNTIINELEQRVRPKTCVGESMTLRRVIRLELTK